MTRTFLTALKMSDRLTMSLVLNWIEKNLIGTIDPRSLGRKVKGNIPGIWRFRVGEYRITGMIERRELILMSFREEEEVW